MNEEIGRGIATLGISMAVIAGVVVTENPNCLWGFLALIFVYYR